MEENFVTKEGNDHIKSIKPWVIKATLLVAAFIAFLNETSLNVALTKFMEIFNISVSTVQWLSTGFMLIMTIVVPATAFIMQRFSTRQIFFSTMFILVLGTVTAAAAQTFWVLLAGRLIQAAGTCIIMSLLINTVLILTPPHKRGTALGVVGLVLLFAPAVTPSIAGLVIYAFGWRWLFLGLLPCLVAITAIAHFTLKNVTEPSSGRPDWLSLMLSTIAFGGIFYGISSSGDAGLASMYTIVPLLIGLLSLVLFVWRQLHIKEPLLELRVFAYPMFTIGVLMVIFCQMTAFGVTMLMPMFMQGGFGLTTFATGLSMLPGGLLNGFVAPIVGRLFDRFGPKPIVIPGLILMMAFAWLFSVVSNTTSIGLFIVIHCGIMMAIAMVMSPAQANGLNQLPRNLYPHGTAIMSTLQQMAGGLGTAVFVSIMSINQQYYLHQADSVTDTIRQSALVYGFNHAFHFGALMLILGIAIALFIKRPVSPESDNNKIREMANI
ncbi:MAG: multidrug transporter [Firmicutes bacterium]|nr:multidrug transporter [Bacillota bacterium]